MNQQYKITLRYNEEINEQPCSGEMYMLVWCDSFPAAQRVADSFISVSGGNGVWTITEIRLMGQL